MNEEKNIMYTNHKKCPCCFSDMTREKTDNIWDVYQGTYTCQNPDCGITTKIYS